MSLLKNPRTLVAAGVVVAAVVLGAVFLPGSDGGDETPRVARATLTLERATGADTGAPELLVSLPSEDLNRPELTDGGRVVWLRCFDAGGAALLRAPADWPLLEEPGLPPHIHQPAGRRVLDRVRRCRLTGPGIAFEGRAAGLLPAAE